MQWNDGDRWSAEISVPPGTTLEFKVVECDVGDPTPSKTVWEPDYNHAIAVPDGGAPGVDVTVRWGKSAECSLSSSSTTSDANYSNDGASTTARDPSFAASVLSSSSSSSSTSSSSSDGYQSPDDLLPSSLNNNLWKGRETVFMTSNEHGDRDRHGVWNTEGLDPGSPAYTLVKGDEQGPSWLNKLELAKSVLVDGSEAWRPSAEALQYTFVFLSWVATGAIECVDAGGHRRPNRHADVGKLTFRSLEWVIGERAGTTDALLARRLQTRLPSFAAEFTQSTPLTRIRDIAHRNDIPSYLKQEIKHTIQNKLHRNAGPEDLVATEALLGKVTAVPGQYPDAFIHEMRLFLAELRDFFNAAGLAESLQAIIPVLDDSGVRIVERFIAHKNALDGAGAAADDNTVMDALHSTASVRALLASGLASGLRNDAPDNALSMRQKWRMAEIRAEDYAFVLLSRYINSLEERGGPGALAGGSDGTWGLPLGALVIALRHVGLCGFQPAECMAIERELATWQQLGGFAHREEALRLRATLQRAQRLAEAYCQSLLDVLSGPAMTLGRALGVAEERSAVFAESEIRANVVFQLSKLALLLQRATTEVAQTTPWDVIMSGISEGILIEAPSLDPGCLDQAKGQDAIIVISGATGDEEVASLGANLKGVVLRHSLPHLSHLGVRARQEQVPFATCDDEQAIESVIRPLIGQRVIMVSEVDGVRFEKAKEGSYLAKVVASNTSISSAGSGGGENGTTHTAVQPVKIQKVKRVEFIPLEAATIESCGAKAAACGALLHLANDVATTLQTSGRGDGAPLFEAPNGVCLPFGCLEAALEQEGGGKAKAYADTLSRVEAVVVADSGTTATASDLDSLSRELNDIITGVRIPQTILLTLGGAFDPGTTVIVRSSANVEDLAGMSGAGLYESVPNIDPRDPEALQTAITSVWASLHTRRALLARATAGVDASIADMAVIIQRQLAPELSFVLHTAHPLTHDAATLVAEVAPGLGEVLASGTRGSAWRLEVERESGSVRTVAFANFSEALMPVVSRSSGSGTDSTADSEDEESGRKQQRLPTPPPPPGLGLSPIPVSSSSSSSSSTSVKRNATMSAAVAPCVVDYSQQEMSWSEEVRVGLGRRLAAVGRLLESEFEGAQDVEGCVMDGRLFIVQTRPQP